MASEDLLKKAVAAFNALSPEQQAEMLEDQRQSWVRGNIGLSRDERGMTSPVMPRPAPAATDTGLVTVAKQWKVTAKNWSGLKPEISEPFDERELVTRSQAEELLAAERADHDNTIATLSSLTEDNAALIHDLNRIKDHETELVNDNAAKDARIKELEDYFSKCISNETFLEQDARRVRQIEALEAKLAAAEKALEPFAKAALGYDDPDENGPWPDIQDVFVTLGDCRRARAVLGGKP